MDKDNAHFIFCPVYMSWKKELYEAYKSLAKQYKISNQLIRMIIRALTLYEKQQQLDSTEVDSSL